MAEVDEDPVAGTSTRYPVIGLDVGSTTVKAVVLPVGGRAMVWSGYRRHEGCQSRVCLDFLRQIEAALPGTPCHAFRIFVTGSGGSTVASQLGAHFVQEVYAVCQAAEILCPTARTLIELGGEDAKIVTFHQDPVTGERRKAASMNDKCAGGTGAVIDRIASKIGLSVESLGAASAPETRIHPVAAKCGVFAETDIVSLQKRGVPPDDLMASLFESIVVQNLAVLARGEALAPRVLLLGGPHAFMPGLVERWRRHLVQRWRDHHVQIPRNEPIQSLVAVPEHALLFGALGAAWAGRVALASNPSLGQYLGREALERALKVRPHLPRNGALIQDDAERAAFEREYMPPAWYPSDLASDTVTEAYLGVDAGSTSTKAVLLDARGEVLAKAYRLSEGNPVEDMRQIARELRRAIDARCAQLRILGVGVTGYAKDTLAHVMRADVAIVETVAHMHAGLHEHPGANVICDVGGQDIKIVFLQNGAVRDFRLNTQCSAGNGFYLQATANMLGIRIEDYAESAFTARAMPVFPYGCAVFLQSDIVDVQRMGWTSGEILAGLAAVLPKNIWLYVCQMHNLPQLGDTFVLQGGVQRNAAAVKAQVDYIRGRFKDSGIKPVIRVHTHCSEAGAIGCALETMRSMQAEGRMTSFIGLDALESVQCTSTHDDSMRCNGCGNACIRTFVDVTLDGSTRRAIFAPCEKGRSEGSRESVNASSEPISPDLVAWGAREAFRVPGVVPVARRRGWRAGRTSQKRAGVRIGFPRVLNLYATAPFFLGYFRALGIPEDRLVWSAFSSDALYREGGKRGCIDPCYPAKLAIAHLHDLVYRVHTETPLSHVFFPIVDTFPTWLDDVVASRACPASTAAVEAATAAFQRGVDTFAEQNIRLKKTFVDIGDPVLAAEQLWRDWRDDLGVSRVESQCAAEAGYDAWARHQNALRAKGRTVMDTVVREGRLALVMLGRPYHADPGISHGVWAMLQRRGYPVLTIDALPIDDVTLRDVFGCDSGPLHVQDVWGAAFSEHSNRKLWAAKYVARHAHLIAIEWSSFRCGMDAPIAATLDAILKCADKPYFAFRDMDENRSPGAIALRLDTLIYCVEQYRRRLQSRAALISAG